MNRETFQASIAILLLASPLISTRVAAQGYGGPLTVEGLHQHANPSAASRAFGGVTVPPGRHAGGGMALMFLNPAALLPLGGLQISAAGTIRSLDRSQTQQYAPVRYFPNLSLLLEGMTGGIPDPDPELVGFTPADSVQRPFDDIGPGWSHSTTENRPLHALVAVPFSIGGVALAVGAGAVHHADLNHYYQNNNVLDPAVLSQRPLPTSRPTDDDPVAVDWYQSSSSREGSIWGYGIALAGYVERFNLTLGIGGILLDGGSEDVERRVERGSLTFFANEFRADPSTGALTRIGSSDYSAVELTFSALLEGRFASLGFAVKSPTTYTRTFVSDVEGDTAGTPISSTITGEDELQLPWRGSVGLLLEPDDRLRIGLEYEFRPYAAATYTSAHNVTEPWRSSSLFRVGTEYELAPWLVVRGGIRGEADVFVPEGRALDDEPVRYTVYSAGFGLTFAGVHWNVAYENARMNYQDIWGSAVSRNTSVHHALVTDISLTIPFGAR